MLRLFSDIITNVRVFFEQVITVIEFLPVVWRHKDWNYAYIQKFNVYLHKRLYKALYVKGHHIPNRKHKRALKAIISLLERLSEDYDTQKYRELDKKWGKREYTFESGRILSSQERNLTPEKRREYVRDLRRVYEKSEARNKQDLIYLHKLLAKYSRDYWD